MILKVSTLNNTVVLSEHCLGPIPPEIVKLVKLEKLVLQINQLTGLIFSQFYPVIFKSYLYEKRRDAKRRDEQRREENRRDAVHHPPFFAVLSRLLRELRSSF